MTDPTQEQLRTEAYWRSTIARELYHHADEVEREANRSPAGVALASIIRLDGDLVGQMPDRTPRVFDREPPAEVAKVFDQDGDVWQRTEDGWVAMVPGGDGEPLDYPTLRHVWGPITARPSGGA